MQNINIELLSLTNEELMELYDLILEHEKYLNDNIIKIESEGTSDESSK